MAIALMSVAGVQTVAGAAPVRTAGTPGKAAQHASVNFKAIAREEALGPMPLNEHRRIHHPVLRAAEGSDALNPSQAAAQEQAP
jgi:hypothetical protein